MKVPPEIFRTYDIRGIVGRSLDAGILRALGRALGSLGRERGAPSFVLGRDGRDSGPELARALAEGLNEAGADVIELGMPFSDPIADGPTIQRASQRALAQKMTLNGTLDIVRAFREVDQDTPIILMGYMNPLVSWGFTAFAAAAAEAGVDGVIVVDCPPEEADPLADALEAHGMSLIFLTTPTTDDRRLPTVIRRASGFVYYVSVAGVTGARTELPPGLVERVAWLKTKTDVPVLVGFGISDPEQVRAVAAVADGAIVGSALVRLVAESADRPRVDLLETLHRRVAALAAAAQHAGTPR